MHSEKVPYYILDLLQQVPSVYVEGLGRFDAIFHPAMMDLHQSQIKPPYVKAGFTAMSESKGDLLPEYMHYVSGIEMIEAKEAISTFVRDIYRHMDTGEPFSIEKFGVFSKSASDILHFTPDWDAFNLSFTGLEVIELHPPQEFKPSEKFIRPEVSSPPVLQPAYESGSGEFLEESPTIETPNVPGVDVQAETIPSYSHTIPESSSRLAWIILTSALTLITVLCAFLAWDIISDRKKLHQYSHIYSDTLAITNEFDIPVIMDTIDSQPDSIPATNPEINTDTIKPPDVIKDTEPPCFVIVGAFTNPGNVSRMVERLESLGYTSEQIKGGTLTRVAIRTSCDKAELQKILSEARAEINPESWIY